MQWFATAARALSTANFRSALRRRLRESDRVRQTYERWFVTRGPGRWLFNYATLGWLGDRQLRRQLPTELRVFAAYCDIQRALGLSGHVIGGLWTFRQLVRAALALGASNEVRVEVGKHVVYLALDDPRCLQVPNELTPDAEVTRLLRRFLKPGDTFIDIGANHGSFSIIAASILGDAGYVLAVEPQPRLARLLARSLREGARCTFDVVELACGESDGAAELYVPRDTSGSAGLFRDFSGIAAHRSVTVPVRRLDDVLSNRLLPGRTLIKLDVEGNELSVLRGAARYIHSQRPRVIVEINPKSLDAAAVGLGTLRSELAALGFTHYSELDTLDRLRSIGELGVERARNIVLFGDSEAY